MAAILKSRISQIPQGWQLHIQLDIIVGMSYNNNLQKITVHREKQLFGLSAGLLLFFKQLILDKDYLILLQIKNCKLHLFELI